MIRRSILFVAAALLCLSQESDWKKVDAPPGVDFSGLSTPQKTAVLAVIRTEPCSCGCAMMVAECRIKDPSCGFSRRLAAFAIRDAAAGKNEAAIRTDLDKYAKEPPPVLEAPVKLNIAGAPFKGPGERQGHHRRVLRLPVSLLRQSSRRSGAGGAEISQGSEAGI